MKLKDVESDVKYLKELSKLNVVRTCAEMYAFGITQSDFYWIDPDGPLTGEEPIRVYCLFYIDGAAYTLLSHDSETKIEVAHCEDPGCYSRKIIYDAPAKQIQALIDLSESCEQSIRSEYNFMKFIYEYVYFVYLSIRYDCFLSALTTENVNYGFWLDKNGNEQIYWDGANSGSHVCACHFSNEGCIKEDILGNTCNCDSQVPEEIYDKGVVTDINVLPITELRFGGLSYDAQIGYHTLGKLACKGTQKYSNISSCAVLKKQGHFTNGYYNIKGNNGFSKLVFCNMSHPGYENEGMEEFISADGKHCILAGGKQYFSECPEGYTKQYGTLRDLQSFTDDCRYDGDYYNWMKSVKLGGLSLYSHSCDNGGRFSTLEIILCCK